VARIHLETEPPAALLNQIRASNPDILEISLIRMK
jgi:hypothetical protein